MDAKKKRILRAVLAWIVVIATAAALVLANFMASRYANLISVYLNMPNQKIVEAEDEETEHFTSDYANEKEMKAHLQEIGRQIEAEGAVLLENNGTLPLSDAAKITILGQDSVDPVYGGGGAGSVDTSTAIDLYTGIREAGYQTNDVVYDFYTEGAGSTYRKTVPDAYGEGVFGVNEVPVSEYTDDVIASFADYNDAAIIVLGRSGGESSDLQSTPLDNGYYYLELDENEKELIDLACRNFENVVVLLNTQNPMELGELEDTDVDAVLWIGALGETGAEAVGDLLCGNISPSGRLTDTYAYDSFSAPAMANFGSYTIANSQVMFGNSYMVYSEGIYVGYRYYETRYEDVVMGNEDAANYNYAQTVQYPFGYGLSYTEFAYSDFTLTEDGNQYIAEVTVTNTGDTSGKHAVEIYMQSPYTDYDRENKIEKSSVELVGYGKTGTIKPGGTETVSVEIPKEMMKVYDQYGQETYIVDAGDYYFTVGADAHDAVNNILAAKGYTTADGMDADGNADLTAMVTQAEQDNTTYAVSQATGYDIQNQFEDVDINTYDPEHVYLSRSDWTGTWPVTYADGSWTAPEDFVAALEIPTVEDTAESAPVTGATDEEVGSLTTAMMMELDYDDPMWDTLIRQMSVEELDTLIRVGGYATMGIDSIQLPSTQDKDGPAGISSTLVGGENGTSYPPEIVLASTWNDELAEEFGRCIGEDSIALDVTGWYAPSMNIHRSPYSGRNFEYYSEDSCLSGMMGAATVRGAQEKGVLVYIKHFALNDQETNRMGISIFANEQSVRDLYLKPFEITVREGDAHGAMVSMNRIGSRWTGAHYGLMTEALRNEWGFEGLAITDQASFEVFAYEDLRAGLAAGTDLWLNTDTELWKLSDTDMNDTIITHMQRAAKNIVFAISRSNAMNGLSSSSQIVQITPLWQMALYVADAVLAVIALLGAVFATLDVVKGNDRKKTLSAVLSGLCSVLLFGGGMAVCILAGSDYYNMGIPLGVVGLILCVLNVVVSVGKTKTE